MSAVATKWPNGFSPEDEPLVGLYHVEVYPPLDFWEPGQTPAVEEALRQPGSPDDPLGLTVYIPFCQTKCDYCHCLSYADARPELVDIYLDSVVSELGYYSLQPAIRGRPLTSVFITGGTPSLLTPAQVRRLFNGLKYFLPWGSVREVCFECAPRSVNRPLLECLREIGVNRLSLGVQSLDNTVLKFNGRIHLVEDVQRAWELIRAAGFDRVNVDLMVGLVGETQERWRDTIRQAIALQPESVTIYQTEIPENTQTYHDLADGELPAPLPDWNTKRQQLDAGFTELAAAGYHVITAYTAVKDPTRHRFEHQQHLWQGGNVLGLGVNACSYLDGLVYQNAVTLEAYRVQIRQGLLPLKRARRLSPFARFVREFILRLKSGEVSVPELRAKYGGDAIAIFGPQLQELAAAGLLTYSANAVRLSREGILCVDRLLPRFYEAGYRPAGPGGTLADEATEPEVSIPVQDDLPQAQSGRLHDQP